MKIARGRDNSSAYFHALSVSISIPDVAETTTIADSQAVRADFTSPVKSGYPGVSMKLIL